MYVTIPQTHSQFPNVSPKDGRTRHFSVFCLELLFSGQVILSFVKFVACGFDHFIL